MGTTRHLAVAARSRQQKLVAGSDGTRPALVGIQVGSRSKKQCMIAPLAKFIDWSVLQMAYVVAPLRHAPKPKWKLEAALEFLNGPDFIPVASDPARIEFDGPRHFKFSIKHE